MTARFERTLEVESVTADLWGEDEVKLDSQFSTYGVPRMSAEFSAPHGTVRCGDEFQVTIISLSDPAEPAPAGPDPRASLAEFIAFGQAKGWVSESFCAMHDEAPMSEDEQARFAAGQDPCQPAVRLWVAVPYFALER